MCCMSRIAPIIVVVPISLLLALSFFVLLSIRKAETKGLKAFGYVVAGILWLSILVIFLGGVYKIAKGGYLAKCMTHKKMMMQNMPAAKENTRKAKDAAHYQNKGVVFKGGINE